MNRAEIRARRQLREVAELRSRFRGLAYDMSELRTETQRAQELFVARLERIRDRAARIVEQQQAIAVRLDEILQSDQLKVWAPTICSVCGLTFDGQVIVDHLRDEHHAID